MSLRNSHAALKIVAILLLLLVICLSAGKNWITVFSRPLNADIYIWIFFGILFFFYILFADFLSRLKWPVGYLLSFLIGLTCSFGALILSVLLRYDDGMGRFESAFNNDFYILIFAYIYRGFLLGGWFISMLALFFYKQWEK
ncbi:hypothetical protein [Thiothrix lacustris]|uniref:hypothetical protein n=1 Tax=Thiothrix lacustris TaxID=525917 RepID=UPI00048B16C5|nr:hypothetical protein [Thiothrix lacustris]